MPFDSRKAVREFLRDRGVSPSGHPEVLVSVVETVARIPWGEGRTIEEVLDTMKCGTCTGKHLLLRACLDELGVRHRSVLCTFRWEEQAIKYPESLKAILAEGGWEHGHNFLQVRLDGSWVDVDVTWNPELAPYGFRTFPPDWDGRTSFVGVDNIIHRWDGADIAEFKKQFIRTLSPEVEERRRRFLEEFARWVDYINKAKPSV